MVKAIILSLIGGIMIGQYFVNSEQVAWFGELADWALVILMISVGISVGSNKEVLHKIKHYHLKIFVIPFGVIIGSLLGGIVSAVVVGLPINEGLGIASGMGWYSLAGVLLTDLVSAEVGTVAFLSSFMREIIAFMIVPIVATKFNHYTAIAPAGATSEDTTLPLFVKYTNEEIVVMAVVNGVVCSMFVPILINIFC